MKLALASKTQPDWSSLSKVIDPRILDKGERTTRAYCSVLQTLGSEPTSHFFYTFYFEILDSDLLSILLSTELKANIDETETSCCKGFITGSIKQWKEAALGFCQLGNDAQIRQFFNAIILYIEHDGVNLGISKNELSDRTFEIKNNGN